MPLRQDTQPADQANVPVMPGTTEEVVEPLNVRKSSRVRKIRPELQEFIQPLKLKKRRDKATIEAEKAAAAEEKVRKAEEKVVTRAKAVNRLAALHIPVDGVVKTPRPSAKVFEQREARRLSQASSMLVVEGESPMVPQNNKRSNTHSDDETLNPTPYKCIKPAEAPSIAPDLDASPKVQAPAGDIDADSDGGDVCDTETPTEEEERLRLEALATVNKKLKEIRARGRVNVEEDNKKAEKAAAKMEARAKKEQEKAEKVAAKEKVREEKQKAKMQKEAEKEAVKMKGKAKPMVGTVELEAAAKSKRSKKGKTDSGTREAIAAVYNKQQEAAVTAMNRDRDEQDALAAGGSGEKEVRKVKGRAAIDQSLVAGRSEQGRSESKGTSKTAPKAT